MLEIVGGIVLAIILVCYPRSALKGCIRLLVILGASWMVFYSTLNHQFAVFMFIVCIIGALLYHNQDTIKRWFYL